MNQWKTGFEVTPHDEPEGAGFILVKRSSQGQRKQNGHKVYILPCLGHCWYARSDMVDDYGVRCCEHTAAYH